METYQTLNSRRISGYCALQKPVDRFLCSAYMAHDNLSYPGRTEMMKSFEDFQTYGKEGMDAYVASAAAVTKGFQTMTAEAVEYARRTFEKGSEAFEQAAAAKSFDKAL